MACSSARLYLCWASAALPITLDDINAVRYYRQRNPELPRQGDQEALRCFVWRDGTADAVEIVDYH